MGTAHHTISNVNDYLSRLDEYKRCLRRNDYVSQINQLADRFSYNSNAVRNYLIDQLRSWYKVEYRYILTFTECDRFLVCGTDAIKDAVNAYFQECYLDEKISHRKRSVKEVSSTRALTDRTSVLYSSRFVVDGEEFSIETINR